MFDHPGESGSRISPWWLCLMVLFSGCTSGEPTAVATPPPQGPTPTQTPTYVVAFRFDFDSGSASLAEGDQVANAGG